MYPKQLLPQSYSGTMENLTLHIASTMWLLVSRFCLSGGTVSVCFKLPHPKKNAYNQANTVFHIAMKNADRLVCCIRFLLDWLFSSCIPSHL